MKVAHVSVRIRFTKKQYIEEDNIGDSIFIRLAKSGFAIGIRTPRWSFTGPYADLHVLLVYDEKETGLDRLNNFSEVQLESKCF